MSTTTNPLHIANFELVEAGARPTRFWSEVTARFYRFLENLPEHHDDIDVDVFKRVPVPV